MGRRKLVLGLVVVAVLAISLPPVDAAPGGLLGKALKLARGADQRSKKALKLAQQQPAKGDQGPEGPQGPPGPNGPGARAHATSVQTLTNGGAPKVIELDTEVFDTGGVYAPPADELVAPITGTYILTGHLNWGADTDGVRQIQLRVADLTVANVIQQTVSPEPNGPVQTLTTVARVNAGESITLRARHEAGNDLPTADGGAGVGFAGLAAQWISP